MKKAKNIDPMFRATIKEVENDRDRRLKLVELKRQRRIQQTERLFDAQEQELECEFEAAKANLKIAWESLYPPNGVFFLTVVALYVIFFSCYSYTRFDL